MSFQTQSYTYTLVIKIPIYMSLITYRKMIKIPIYMPTLRIDTIPLVSISKYGSNYEI